VEVGIPKWSEQPVWRNVGATQVQLGADLVQLWCSFVATCEDHFFLDFPKQCSILGHGWCNLRTNNLFFRAGGCSAPETAG
jgi:hypothetical protein